MTEFDPLADGCVRLQFAERSAVSRVTHRATGKTKPTSVKGANESLVVSVLSKDATLCIGTAGHRRIRDDAPVPNTGNKFLFRKQPFPIGNEVSNQIKGSRFDLNKGTVASQLPKRAVQQKLIIVELGKMDTSASLRFGVNATRRASAFRGDGGR